MSSKNLWIETYEHEREVWLHAGPAFSRLDQSDATGPALMRVLRINYFEKYAVEHPDFSNKLTLKYQNVSPVFVLHNNI